MARPKKHNQRLIVRGDAAGLWLFVETGEHTETLIGAFGESQVKQWMRDGVEITLEGKAERLAA